MNRPLGAAILLLLSLFTAKAQDLPHLKIKQVRQCDSVFVSGVEGLQYKEMRPFLQKNVVGLDVEGIALHRVDGSIVWARKPIGNTVEDIQLETGEIHVLSVDFSKGKSYSNSTLYETVYNLSGDSIRGRLLSRFEIDHPDHPVHAQYDGEGKIWDWIEWDHSLLKIDGREVPSRFKFNLLVRCQRGAFTSPTLIGAREHVNFAKTIAEKGACFALYGDSMTVNERKFYEAKALVICRFGNEGALTSSRLVSTGLTDPYHVFMDDNMLLIAGAYIGGEGDSIFPPVTFQGQALPSTVFYKRNTANACFITRLDEQDKVIWVKTINSIGDVDPQTMSVLGDSVVIAFQYDREVTIVGERTITSLKEEHDGFGADAAIAFFDRNGKLLSAYPARGTNREELSAILLPSALVFFGFTEGKMAIFDSVFDGPPQLETRFLQFLPR